jgi:hypothetical protein
VHAKPLVRSVHISSLYFSCPALGTRAPSKCIVIDYTFNYLHRGAPQYWIIVALHKRMHLEKCL